MQAANQDAWRAALFAAVIFVYRAIFSISDASTIGMIAKTQSTFLFFLMASNVNAGNVAAALLTLAAPQFLALDSPAGDDTQTIFLIIFCFLPGVVFAFIWKKLSSAA